MTGITLFLFTRRRQIVTAERNGTEEFMSAVDGEPLLMPSLSDARKEQIKLRGTFLNGIGIGVILIGVFTPIIRILNDPALSQANLLWAGLSLVVCFILGLCLHYAATRILDGLDP
jgi:uncharacterized membrane protein